jgi:hypothetical protein
MRFTFLVLFASLLGMLSGTAKAAEKSVYIEQVSCTGAPFGLRLPASMRNVYLLGKIQKDVVGEVEQWDGYSATRKTIHFPGLVLGVVTFSNDPNRYLLSYAEVSDAKWNKLSPFPIGAQLSAIRKLMGPVTNDVPLLNVEFVSESDGVKFLFKEERLAKVTYDCYTG